MTKEKTNKSKKSKKVKNPNAKWYVLNIRTGYENSIKKELKQRAEATGLEDKIVDILIPVQKKISVKKGKQDVGEEKIFPGYILIKMELDNKTWDIVTNTEGVRGFVKTDRSVSYTHLIGALAMVLFRFGWSKPVPINEYNFKKRELGTAITALAGPLSNMIIATICGLINWIFNIDPMSIGGRCV